MVIVGNNRKEIDLPYPIKIGSQGRITIPFEVRESLGITDKDRIFLTLRRADDENSIKETWHYPIQVGSQGRVTVPFEIRESLGLIKGDRVFITIAIEKEESPI